MKPALLSNVKIAVVEPEALTRDFIANVMMYSVNREVKAFSDLEGIKQHLKTQSHFDLILAEARLPGGGLELLRMIKKTRPETVFVVLSADPEDEKPAAELNADAFLAKPFLLKDLFEIVQRFVVEGS